ncbi:hypothetical protein DQQ10_05750 [Pseudochryseolinea flava]|uniref:Uncharacterized protein n=1 Tax=Pseudochryseolinea flava TaxID=2059302 RepID=A0A364Y4Y7_9BACT|nr:hypothetical protein DQQ10_05750 [Pseudochryseolinea flava]
MLYSCPKGSAFICKRYQNGAMKLFRNESVKFRIILFLINRAKHASLLLMGDSKTKYGGMN